MTIRWTNSIRYNFNQMLSNEIGKYLNGKDVSALLRTNKWFHVAALKILKNNWLEIEKKLPAGIVNIADAVANIVKTTSVATLKFFQRLAGKFKTYGIKEPFAITVSQFESLQSQVQTISEEKALKSIWTKLSAVFKSRNIEVPSQNASITKIKKWMNNPANASSLNSIKRLDLSGLQMKALPPEMGKLTHLQELNLQANQIQTLPASMNQLTKLRKLNLADNRLTSFPDVIGTLANLEELNLSFNKIDSISDAIRTLVKLNNLDLSNNNLSILPKIDTLTSLEILNLSNNQLSSLPDGMNALGQLQKLYLNNNQFSSLPDSIGSLTQLEILFLENNKISVISDSITALSNLNILSVKNNQLTALPGTIGNLNQLQVLLVDNNQLNCFPASMRSLNNLCTLGFENNQFISFPDVIQDLQNLAIVNLDNNPLGFISPNILSSPILRRSKMIANYKKELEFDASSSLAKLYQSIIRANSEVEIKAYFSALSREDKTLILEMVDSLAGVPQTEDHVMDDMSRFYLAVRKMIVKKLTNLPIEKYYQVAIHVIGTRKVDEAALSVNLPRLADALEHLQL